MSKMIVVGDLHFGVRNGSLKYLEFQLSWFRNELFPLIKKTKAEHILFLGDIFDNRVSISPLILKRTREIFKELVALDITVHCLIGNHDLYYKSTREVHSLDVLTDNGCIVYEDMSPIEIEGKSCLMMPWITKNDLDYCERLLTDNEFDLCFGHLEINGFQLMKGIIEHDGLQQDLFINCKKVFSGHFHIRGVHNNIQYTGTPYELDFGDAYSPKGVDVVDLDTLENEFVESKYIPRHLKLKSSEYPINKLTKKVISNNFITMLMDRTMTEVESIDYIEKINSLEPLSIIIDDEGFSVDGDDIELDSSIKDTLGFLSEFINLIELPDGIEQKELINKMREYHSKVTQ